MNLSAEIGPEPFSILNPVIKAATAFLGRAGQNLGFLSFPSSFPQVPTPITGQKPASLGQQSGGAPSEGHQPAHVAFTTTRRR